MRCNVCHASARYERTVFHDAKPTTIRLCDACSTKVQLVDRMHKIKEAATHEAKTQAVDELISAVESARS